MRRLTWVLLPVAAVFLFFLYSTVRPNLLRSQTPPSLSGADTASFLIEFGVTDKDGRPWDGSLAVSGGQLADLRDWRPRKDNSVQQSGSWKLSTVRGVDFNWRPWERTPGEPAEPYIWTQGVVADVSGAGAKVSVKTANGSFDFRSADVLAGQPKPFLNGAVVVHRVPTAGMISGSDHQNDFATILGSANGEVWVAWIAYRNNANEVLARRFDGSRWQDTVRVSEAPGDHHLVKLGRDGKGRVWAVWSQQKDGNFDVYARGWDGKTWGSVERLSTAPQPDIFPAVATDSKGQVWVAWQGFRNGRSDVFARHSQAAGGWSEEAQVSTSPANDWEPVIAADSKGQVYVAWDTYDQGNYDVMLRAWDGDRWQQTTAISDTPLFEAHVSLAVDKQNRLWAAWNESGVNWGKDTGYSLNLEGTPLYAWRRISVAVKDGASWKEPASDINTALPKDLQDHNDFPKLHTDEAGRVSLFFRHRTSRIHDVPSSTPNHRASWEVWQTWLNGGKWASPVYFPFTRDRMDVRWDLANDGKGNVFAAWPTDNRDYEEFLFEHSDVYAARLPGIPGAAQAPALNAREPRKIPYYSRNPNEPEDLKRIHGYELRSGGKTYRIYRGDTHRHSEFSMDGNNDGSLLEVYRYAIDAAELDYLMESEHNGAGGPDIEYINWLLQQTVDLLYVPARFRPIYGYERSVSYPNGHRNVLLPKRGTPTLPIPQSEAKGQTGAQALYEYLKKYDGIAISHTSATNMGTDWRDNDPNVEPLVEIYQGDRVSAEYLGAPRAANAKEPGSAPGGFRPLGYVWNAWAKGYKLGVQAASDHLSTHISYACTIAEDFSIPGLLDAMKKRHSYGATDNIILDYRMTSGGKEYLQGDIVTVDAPFQLSVHVIGTSPIRQLDIIRNEEFIHNRQHLDQEVNFTYTDRESKPGENLYYVRVIQNDGELAWSSPIWVTKR